MKLIVLGSGTSVPHAGRASAAHWLETASGSLLLDVSPDAAHRMAQQQLPWANLDCIWVSHFHLDHMGGLAPLLFGLKWAPQTEDRRKALKIYGGKGLGRVLSAIDKSNDYNLLTQRFPIELVEIAPGADFEILPGLDTRTASTPHTEESLAIRLRDKRGSSLVYTSDTGYSEHLADFSRAADVLLIDCSFRRNKPVATHLELIETMKLVRESSPNSVVLTHLYPEWDGFDIVAEARNLWSGKILEAVDGLEVEF